MEKDFRFDETAGDSSDDDFRIEDQDLSGAASDDPINKSQTPEWLPTLILDGAQEVSAGSGGESEDNAKEEEKASDRAPEAVKETSDEKPEADIQPPHLVLQDMQERMRLGGAIESGDDPRINELKDFLHHSSPEIRLAAAKILADPKNTGCDREGKELAMKAALREAVAAERDGHPDNAYAARKIMRTAGKELGDVEIAGEGGRTMHFVNGELRKISLPDGKSVEVDYDKDGSIKAVKMPPDLSLVFSRRLDNGMSEWKKPDGSSWVGSVTVSPDGQFGWQSGNDFHIHHSDGSESRSHSFGPYRQSRNGDHFQQQRRHWVNPPNEGWYTGYSSNHDALGNSRTAQWNAAAGEGGRWELKDSYTRPGDTKPSYRTVPLDGSERFDVLGTAYKVDKETGNLVGETMYGSTIRKNNAGLPEEIKAGESSTKFKYKSADSNELSEIQRPDGTKWLKQAGDKWQIVKDGKQIGQFTGSVDVSTTGEYTVTHSDGKRDVHKLSGAVETHFKDGAIVTSFNGEVRLIVRPDGSTETLTWSEVDGKRQITEISGTKNGEQVSWMSRNRFDSSWIVRKGEQPNGSEFSVSADRQGTMTYEYPDKTVKVTLDGKRIESAKQR